MSKIRMFGRPLRYKSFRRKYKDCQACPLYHNRHKIVFYRGDLDAPTLLIGEAPGFTENTLGRPFVGSAGKLLDKILFHADLDADYDVCITNVVCCIPWNEDQEVRPPSPAEISACQPRLLDFLRVVKPRRIVHLGRSAENAWKSYEFPFATPTLAVRHPAYILRQGGEASVEFYRCAVQIRDFVKETR